MSLKEKFMDNMLGQMSFSEKKAMMNEMMEKFFAGMSPQEKQDLMGEMMGKMMSGSGGGGGDPFPMMGMMRMMMGGQGKEGDVSPMDMCKKMMASMAPRQDASLFPTPDIRALFEDWASQLDTEILEHLAGGGPSDVESLAAALKISRESVISFLARLAQQGKVNLKPERLSKTE